MSGTIPDDVRYIDLTSAQVAFLQATVPVDAKRKGLAASIVSERQTDGNFTVTIRFSAPRPAVSAPQPAGTPSPAPKPISPMAPMPAPVVTRQPSTPEPVQSQPLAPAQTGSGELLNQIVRITQTSPVMRYDWPSRGVPPPGYIKGMALVFARVYCKLLANVPSATEVAQLVRNDPDDVLVHYGQRFTAAGMDNSSSAADRLRHLVTLLVGHGMRESSGECGEGADPNNHNQTADTSEAGLFQTSYDLVSSVGQTAPPLMNALMDGYAASGDGFLDVFREGCRWPPKSDVGTGRGQQFQQLCKTCPAFGAEFTLIGYRHQFKHWGPIVDFEAELNPDCDRLFAEVQALVDQSPQAAQDALLPRT